MRSVIRVPTIFAASIAMGLAAAPAAWAICDPNEFTPTRTSCDGEVVVVVAPFGGDYCRDQGEVCSGKVAVVGVLVGDASFCHGASACNENLVFVTISTAGRSEICGGGHRGV